jgi:hypothetical protein
LICGKQEYTAMDPDTHIIVGEKIGFTLLYLRQLMIRLFRCAATFLGEATTIRMTFDDTSPECEGTAHLQYQLSYALCLILYFREGRFKGLKVDYRLSLDGQQYDQQNGGFHSLFSARVDDPGFDKSIPLRHVATDGNVVLRRDLCSDELKSLRGSIRTRKRPAATVVDKPEAAPSLHSRKKPAARPESRCAAGAGDKCEEAIEPDGKKTEGLMGSVDMQSNEILHMGEMLNAECGAYKDAAADDVCGGCNIGVIVHDCACIMLRFEGLFCERIILPGHAKHKCDKRRFDPKHVNNVDLMKGLNSEAAEQLWSRMDTLSICLHKTSRPLFRMLVKHSCIWRNEYERGCRRGNLKRDVCPRPVRMGNRGVKHTKCSKRFG